MTRRSDLLLDVLVSLGRHALSVAAGIATLACVGRVLGADALGAWSTMGTMSFVIGVAELGLSTAIQRAAGHGIAGRAERALGTALRAVALFAPPIALALLFALHSLLARGVHDVDRADLSLACIISILAGLVAAPAMPIRALLLVRGGVRTLALARGVASLLQLVLVVAGLLATRMLVAAAVALFAAQLVELSLLIVLGRRFAPELVRFPRGARDRAELREFAHDASATLVVNAAALLSTRLDIMVLAACRPLSEVGAYAVASRAVEQALALAKQSSNAMVGRLADPRTREEGMRVGASALGAVGVSGLVAIAVLGQPLLALWVGPAARHETVAPVLALLATSAVIICLAEVPSSALLLGASSPWRSSLPITIGTVVNVTTTIVATPALGGVGAATGTVVGYAISLALLWRGARAVGWRTQFAVPAIVAGMAALTCAVFLRPFATDAARAAAACVVASLVGLASGIRSSFRGQAATSCASTTST